MKRPPSRQRSKRDADALTANIVVGILGVSAFAVSFTHVVQTSVRAGQTGWVAYAIAVSVELMALGSVSEIRRRKRRGHLARWPSGVLILGVVMSLAANLDVAQPTTWGYVMAAWPSVAFLAAAGTIESRPADPLDAEPKPSNPTTRTAEPDAGHTRTDLKAPPLSEHAFTRETAVPGEESPVDPGTHSEPDAAPAVDAPQPSQERPTRTRVLTDLLAAMRTEPDWRPDYGELIRTTGYSRSWCEKRVREARRLHARTEIDSGKHPADRTAAAPCLGPIHPPRPVDVTQPAPAEPGSTPIRTEPESEREDRRPRTAAPA